MSYSHGVVRSFTDNGDGTITDNATGLMWEKKSDDGSIHDWDNSYSWSTGTSQMDGTIVTAFLATLNGGGGFAGHTDWRIPNIRELETLINLGEATGVYPEFNDSCTAGCTVTTCSCNKDNLYWSSTTLMNLGPEWVQVVDFPVGYSYERDKVTTILVRAVRGGY